MEATSLVWRVNVSSIRLLADSEPLARTVAALGSSYEQWAASLELRKVSLKPSLRKRVCSEESASVFETNSRLRGEKDFRDKAC